MEASIRHALKRGWWLLALAGVVAILFGVIAFAWPAPTVLVLMVLFGCLALVYGVFATFGSLTNRVAYEHWWLTLLGGLASIAVGILAFVWPGLTALVLLYLIAAWAVVLGILGIVMAVRLRKQIKGELILILCGIISVLFGLVAFIWPVAGALTILWLIALYAIFMGVLLLALAYRARSWSIT